jgi:hypothetical protein
VFRSALLAACVALSLCMAPESARGDEMDPALSRLRIARTDETCIDQRGGTFCADQELFERLAAELAVAMAPPVIGPARTIGPRAFQLTLGTTVTSIEEEQVYWKRGSEGDKGLHQPRDVLATPVDESQGPALGFNESPGEALAWNHLQFRKGLPFGFEAGAMVGQGLQTSLWTLGVALKWSLFEGFRTGLGQLPDVAVQGAIAQSAGSSQMSVQLYSFDLTLSKPFVIRQTWSVSPLLGLQLLRTEAESGVIDLTPGGPPLADETPSAPPPEDAYGSCRPQPGHQLTSTPPATIVCSPDASGDAGDFANDVTFDPVGQTRLRLFLGGQTRYRMLVFSASLLFDLVVPELESRPSNLPSRDLARQLAFTFSVGAVL